MLVIVKGQISDQVFVSLGNVSLFGERIDCILQVLEMVRTKMVENKLLNVSSQCVHIHIVVSVSA